MAASFKWPVTRWPRLRPPVLALIWTLLGAGLAVIVILLAFPVAAPTDAGAPLHAPAPTAPAPVDATGRLEALRANLERETRARQEAEHERAELAERRQGECEAGQLQACRDYVAEFPGEPYARAARAKLDAMATRSAH
jgi:hypothetical protein